MRIYFWHLSTIVGIEYISTHYFSLFASLELMSYSSVPATYPLHTDCLANQNVPLPPIYVWIFIPCLHEPQIQTMGTFGVTDESTRSMLGTRSVSALSPCPTVVAIVLRVENSHWTLKVSHVLGGHHYGARYHWIFSFLSAIATHLVSKPSESPSE